jgi:2-C-methyl-D-erythritol 4-phosphate cytidylyltransferase
MPFLKSIGNAFLKYSKKKSRIRCCAIIVAAGSASRMKGTDKIMTNLEEAPVIVHTLRAFQNSDAIQEIVVVTKAELLATISELCLLHNFTKVQAVVLGGSSRLESVLAGLEHVSAKMTYIAVHDGARPLISVSLIDRTVQKAVLTNASAPALPVKDTVKIARGSMVVDTPKRSELFAVQTPQVFDRDLLAGALKKAKQEKWDVTDDCSAVEKFGMTVHLVEGENENIKITTPIDLVVAQAILKRRRDQL